MENPEENLEADLAKEHGQELTPPKEDVVEPVADAAPVEPEPVKDAEPVVPVAEKAEAPVKYESPATKRLAEVEALIEADEFDPFSKEGKKTLIEHNRLAAKVEAEPLHAAERDRSAYAHYKNEYPDITEKEMRDEFTEQLKVYGKRGFQGDALQIAATTAFELKLEQKANGHKGQKTAQENKDDPKPTAKTPITAKGGRVVPPSGTSVPAQPKAKTDEEELVENMKNLEPRGIKALLR